MAGIMNGMITDLATMGQSCESEQSLYLTRRANSASRARRRMVYGICDDDAMISFAIKSVSARSSCRSGR